MDASKNTVETYRVEGMTCGHCEISVREEVEAVEGVDSALADRATGRLEVTGAGFADAAITAAVEAVGYRLVSRSSDAGRVER